MEHQQEAVTMNPLAHDMDKMKHDVHPSMWMAGHGHHKMMNYRIG